MLIDHDMKKVDLRKATGISTNTLAKLNSEYTENDKQVTIYLFRGLGCTHCKDFLEFLNSNVSAKPVTTIIIL